MFDDKQLKLTDIYQNWLYRRTYDNFFDALKKPLEYDLKNTYKRRQYQRELEALLLAAWEGQNSLKFCHFQGHLSEPLSGAPGALINQPGVSSTVCAPVR